MNKNLLKVRGIFGQKISLREQAYFASRLAFLVNAEISVLRALEMLSEQSQKKREKEMLDVFISGVSRGEFLSVCIENSDYKFNKLAIHIIRTGEMTGTLGINLQYVSDELKKRQILFQKIMSALLYPACIAVATIGVTGMIILYVLPKITPIFSTLGARLPQSTQILLSTQNIISRFWPVLLFLYAVLFVGVFWVWKKIPKIRLVLETLLLKIPILGSAFRQYEVVQSFRTLSLLLRSGVSLEASVENISRSCVGLCYKNEYASLSNQISKGFSMSQFVFMNRALFPVMVGQMIRVGESSGNLSEVFLYISEYYERELDEVIKKVSSMLEPVLMIFIGCIVGFIAISVISPIYEITQNIKR